MEKDKPNEPRGAHITPSPKHPRFLTRAPVTRMEITFRDLAWVLLVLVLGALVLSQQNSINDTERIITNQGALIDSLRIESAKIANAPSALAALQGRLNALEDRVRSLEAKVEEATDND